MFLRRFLSPLLSRIIMPSRMRKDYMPDQINWADLRINRTEKGVVIRNRKIKSTDNARIDCCEYVNAKGKKSAASSKKVIIHAVGNFDVYENHTQEFITEAKKFPDTMVVGFNSRGVLASTGNPRSENDWIDDAVSLIEHYRAQGIKTENILLTGHSLGGAIVTLAAAKLYQQDCQKAKLQNPRSKAKIPCVKLINNRSFANLTEAALFLSRGAIGGIVGLMYGSLGAGLALLGGVSFFPTLAIFGSVLLTGLLAKERCAPLLRPWLKGLLWLGFGTMDAARAYKTLPKDSVDYLTAKNDGISGLHRALKTIHLAEPKKDLLNRKDSKIAGTNNNDSNFVHNAPLNQLFTYHRYRSNKTKNTLPKQISGQEVMDRKIRRLFHI